MNVRDRRWRFLLVVPLLALAISLIFWRGPDWRSCRTRSRVVRWDWVVAAIGLNLLSVLARAFAWDTAIKQSIPPPHPRFPLVFSAFSVGLFANAVLPGRVGELARVAVLAPAARRPRKGTTATLVGSVFAHRMFDLFPAATLVVWVLFTAKIPGWALTVDRARARDRRRAVRHRGRARAPAASRCSKGSGRFGCCSSAAARASR